MVTAGRTDRTLYRGRMRQARPFWPHLNRIQYDTPAVQSITVDTVLPFLTAGLTLAAMLHAILRLDWRLALVALAVAPALFLLARTYSRHLRRQSREVKQLESSALSVVQEVLSALRVVKAFGQKRREHDRFVGRSREGMRARLRLLLHEGVCGLLVGVSPAVGAVAVLHVGMSHVRDLLLEIAQGRLAAVKPLVPPTKEVPRRAFHAAG